MNFSYLKPPPSNYYFFMLVFIQVRDLWKPHPLADFTSGGDLDVTLHEAFGEILWTKDAAISIHVHLCYE